MKKNRLGLMWGIFLLGAGPALAEPSESIKYLMSERMSLFDNGLMRIEEHLYRHLGENWGVLVNYDWNKNAIFVRVWRDDIEEAQKTKDSPTPKDMATRAIGEVKKFCGYNEDGKLINPDTGGLIGSYFSHRGYVSKQEPKSIVADVNGIVEITAAVQGKKERIEGKTKLTEKKVNWSTVKN
ncbi:MAG TPA: hypothetical protein P5079_02870 [Elusimicrobiota bacterium]|nr:hypothetical protein [Elusimicrobiota bacterium]